MKKPSYLTREGAEKLRAELKHLEGPTRQDLAKRLRSAIQMGDLSENADYAAAKEEQAFIEGRIAELEDKLARAQVIIPSQLSGSNVKFGATVKVFDEDTEEEHSYKIVGEDEADVKAGKISIGSPIARAMIGKEVGDVVEVNAPSGIRSLEIVDVKWI